MGTDGRYGYGEDGEGPAHEVCLSPFSIAPHAVTNAQFAAFVDATGYRTEAEEWAGRSCSRAFSPTTSPPRARSSRHRGGARCSVPTGRIRRARTRRSTTGPTIPSCTSRGMTRARSALGRVPACRPRRSGSTRHAAGSCGCRFPWGEELEPGGEHRMNVFQGTFSSQDTAADGYAGTAPVQAFELNGYGLHPDDGQRLGMDRRLVPPRLLPAEPAREPARTLSRHRAGHARRLLPLPRVLLQPLPRRRPQLQHP